MSDIQKLPKIKRKRGSIMLVKLLVIALIVLHLPFIGTEPYEGVEPMLDVMVAHNDFWSNDSVYFTVNNTVVWTKPVRYVFHDFFNRTATHYWGTTKLFFEGENRLAWEPVEYNVSVSVQITCVDNGSIPIEWQVRIRDDQVGILYDEQGYLWYNNQTICQDIQLNFQSPDYPMCGGFEPYPTPEEIAFTLLVLVVVIAGCASYFSRYSESKKKTRNIESRYEHGEEQPHKGGGAWVGGSVRVLGLESGLEWESERGLESGVRK